VTVLGLESAFRRLTRIVDRGIDRAPNAAVASEVVWSRGWQGCPSVKPVSAVCDRMSGALDEAPTQPTDGMVAAVHDPDRPAELRSTGLLDGEFKVALDRITSLAARAERSDVRFPRRRKLQHVVSSLGLSDGVGATLGRYERARVALSRSYCHHAIATGSVLS
jgi:hypothetical protein